MAKRASRLGRGLGGLIAGGTGTSSPSTSESLPSAFAQPKVEVTSEKVSSPVVSSNELRTSPSSSTHPKSKGESLVAVPIGEIVVNPHQPRKVIDPETIRELAFSIEAEGLLQPVTLRKTGDQFELIAGERRWRAHQHLGRKTILARVLTTSDLSSASLSLVENLQREGLNPVEEAMGYHSLVTDFNLTQAKVSERVGKSRAHIANLLRLLQLNEELKGFLAAGKLSTGHAKVLLGLTDEETQLLIGRRVVREQWTVRQCEQAVEEVRNPPSPSSSKISPRQSGNPLLALARETGESLGRKVSIKSDTSGRGKITLTFEDRNDLDTLLASLRK